MMKFLRVLCVLALALCVTASVYAETQSVKVSGDLTMRGIARNGYDYRGTVDESDSARNGTGRESYTSFALTNAEVEVAADLTDNVQTVIRLVNQREWNVANKNIVMGTPISDAQAGYTGTGGYALSADEYQVAVDLAYVTLKEFVYSPLTVTIGRQDLWFGKGFIVGANQQDPTGMLVDAREYTTINSFDAIKAVLDYDPWTITGVYSNIRNNAVNAPDGIDLWGINVGYKFAEYKAEAEGYWFWKDDNSVEKWAAIKDKNSVHTFGVRGSLEPMDVLYLFGETAWQTGTYVGNRVQQNQRDRSAFALDVGGEWKWLAEKLAWKPKFGAEYILYSGNNPENTTQAAGTYNGWDMMYRGKFDSAIREYIGRFYNSFEYQPRQDVLDACADASYTNQSQVVFSASATPVEAVTLKANYNLFWNMEPYLTDHFASAAGGPVQGEQENKTGGFIGQELDLSATWDYTEDVSFNVLGAFFVPGEVYQNADKTAADLVGSVKVNF